MPDIKREGATTTVQPEVSLVIAAYNSARDIEGTLEKVQAYFGQQPYAHEVIVVNDGSTDDTEVILQTVSRRYPELQVLTNLHNRGKGFSIKKGILEAT